MKKRAQIRECSLYLRNLVMKLKKNVLHCMNLGQKRICEGYTTRKKGFCFFSLFFSSRLKSLSFLNTILTLCEISYKCEQNQSSSHFKLCLKYLFCGKSSKSRVSWLTKSADFGQNSGLIGWILQFKMRRTLVLFAFISEFGLAMKWAHDTCQINCVL